MAAVVVVHVGAPKTGTSFVQDLLFAERDRLRADGVLYPAERFDAHFLAALDLLDLPWGGVEGDAAGAWDRLAAEVRAWPGTAIVSHEILAVASRAQAARAWESLAGDGTELHLVYSARDLVRQIPAEWQENVKHRREATYADFLAGLRDPERREPTARWFWAVQEVPDVLDRWGAALPPSRVHVVTVPPPGAPPDLLWSRFARVIGLDPTVYVPATTRTNASLGVAEAALLRRLNVRIGDLLGNDDYRELVREHLVHRNLAGHRTSPRLSVPGDVWTWADGLSRTWTAELAARGYDVAGDLDDLLPRPALPWHDPDDPAPDELADAALEALAAMTLEAARLRAHGRALRAEVDRLGDRLRRLRRASALYRRLRGRNSRST